MSFDFPTTLIAAVFAAQILVCSFITAWRFGKTARLVREKYPPHEYPKLYPISPEKLSRRQNLSVALCLGVGVTATVLLVFDLARGTDAGSMANHMIWVAMGQMLSIIFFGAERIAMMRTLRAMPAPAVRSADLRPWRVTDFVSPTAITLGIAASILCLACATWFWLQWPAQNLPIHMFSWVIGTLLLVRMLYVLLTPLVIARPDPYMAEGDVFRSRQLRLRVLFGGAFSLGVYITFMEMYAARQLRFEYFYLAAGVSILIQLLMLRMTQMIRSAIMERDLSPYRAEPI